MIACVFVFQRYTVSMPCEEYSFAWSIYTSYGKKMSSDSKEHRKIEMNAAKARDQPTDRPTKMISRCVYVTQKFYPKNWIYVTKRGHKSYIDF